jgi:hypothetical protein
MPAADTLTTVAQLLRLADQNVAPEFATNLLRKAPLVAALSAVLANASQGHQHKYLRHISAPAVGFRAANTGLDATASNQELVTIDLKNISAPVRIDTQIGDAHPQGSEALLDMESELALIEAFKILNRVLLYGTLATVGIADGFSGLLQATTVATIAGGSVNNAGGSSNRTSILMLKLGPRDVEMIVGREGNITQGPTYKQLITDANGKHFPAYCRDQEALATVKVGARYSLARIANIAANTTVNDALIYDAFELFPEDQPDLIVMNKRTISQLRKSRTATTTKGTPAPYPTEVEGIPILVDPNLSNAEAAVA